MCFHRPHRASRVSAAVLGLALTLTTQLSAQSTFGTLIGTVTDASAAVIPGSTVTVTNVATDVQRSTTTDATGAYQLQNLDAGHYRITIALNGFQEQTRETDLLARQTARVDVQLPVAGTVENVQVTAASPVIETDRATLDSSKSGDDINKLALNFRATNNTSPIVVATLSPAVQQDRGSQISIAGNLPFMTSFSVDGISSQRTRGGGPSRELFPSVESIAEFKVSAANNNAEFMQVTDITTTTKSGTNVVHGTGFWFGQDSKFSAVDRFAPRDAAGKAIKPSVQANSFGASAGGPVMRNKSFFFGTYEGVRRPNEVTLSQLVPPDAFRTGDLSVVSRQLVNPVTGQPFPNNQIPVHPASAKILETLYERQNHSTGSALNRPNFITNAAGTFDVNGFDGRFDHNFNANQKMFARVTYKEVATSGRHGQLQHAAGDAVLEGSGAAGRGVTQRDSERDAPERNPGRVFVHAGDLRVSARLAGRGSDPELRLHRVAADAGVGRAAVLRIRRRHVHLDRRRQAAQHPQPHAAVQRQPDVDPRLAQRQERRRRPVRRVQGSGHVLRR